MSRGERGYDFALFTADYTEKEDCGEMFNKKDGELSARIKEYLRSLKSSSTAAENLLKVGFSCNTFAAITRSRLLFWGCEAKKNEVAFAMYNQALTLDAPELYYLLNAVSAEATISLTVSDRFPETMCMIVSLQIT